MPHSGLNPKRPEDADNRRRHGRVRVEQVRTGLGKLMDLSASGMRVRGAKAFKVGHMLDVDIDGHDGSFMVRAKVVWCKRAAPWQYELGLEFVDVDLETRAFLAVLVRHAAAGGLLVQQDEGAE